MTPTRKNAPPPARRYPAYSGSGWWGRHSSPRFSLQPPPLSPSPRRGAAAQDFGESSRREHVERPPHARGCPPPPPPPASAGRKVADLRPFTAGGHIWHFRSPVAAPSDEVVGEHLAQPRQGRIAACRYGFVLPPPPTVCGHGFGRPSTGLGARAAALWLADAAHTVRRLHADSAVANFGHAEAPQLGVLQTGK